MDIKTREDLIGLSIKFNIDKYEIIGNIKKKDNFITLNFSYENDEIFKFINDNEMFFFGTETSSSIPITIITLSHPSTGTTYTSKSKKNIYHASYNLDWIIIGKRYDAIENVCFKNYSIFFKDINSFVECNIFKNNFLNKNIEYSSKIYTYNTNFGKLSVATYPCILEIDNKVLLNSDIVFEICNDKVLNFYEIKKQSCTLMNLLMIIQRKNIEFEDKMMYLDKEKSIYLINCIKENKYKYLNNNYKRLMEDCSIKLQDINNFGECINNFFDKAEVMYPIMELYNDVTKYTVPSTIRLINCFAMIENFCRNFLYDQSLARTNVLNIRRRDEPEFRSMVYELINNVNENFNFSDDEILMLSKNIKDARTYYIHSISELGIKLDELKIKKYIMFIEDCILLNMYKLIQLDCGNLRLSMLNILYTKEILL